MASGDIEASQFGWRDDDWEGTWAAKADDTGGCLSQSWKRCATRFDWALVVGRGGIVPVLIRQISQ
jgi:hypothetical protein